MKKTRKPAAYEFGRNTTAQLAIRLLPGTAKELQPKLRVSRISTNVALTLLVNKGYAYVSERRKEKYGLTPVYSAVQPAADLEKSV